MANSELEPRCRLCLKNSWLATLDKHNVSSQLKDSFLSEFDHILSTESTKGAPELQRQMAHLFSKITAIEDPFSDQKSESNKLALKLYNEWKPIIESSPNPFDKALRLSLAANIMDYGAASSFNVYQTIEKVFQTELAIDDCMLLKNEIEKADKILYLGDNAGEQFFDKLFIETIDHKDVTYVVRGGYALNDATIVDAHLAKINEVANVISNGYDAPSTILEKCSSEFISAFEKADLIISKGMGNLEGLMKLKDDRIFFLLMAKCDVTADYLSVEKGSFVVARNRYS